MSKLNVFTNNKLDQEPSFEEVLVDCTLQCLVHSIHQAFLTLVEFLGGACEFVQSWMALGQLFQHLHCFKRSSGTDEPDNCQLYGGSLKAVQEILKLRVILAQKNYFLLLQAQVDVLQKVFLGYLQNTLVTSGGQDLGEPEEVTPLSDQTIHSLNCLCVQLDEHLVLQRVYKGRQFVRLGEELSCCQSGSVVRIVS